MTAAVPNPVVALARLSRRLGTPPPTCWSPPPLPELIDRINAALARRRDAGPLPG